MHRTMLLLGLVVIVAHHPVRADEQTVCEGLLKQGRYAACIDTIHGTSEGELQWTEDKWIRIIATPLNYLVFDYDLVVNGTTVPAPDWAADITALRRALTPRTPTSVTIEKLKSAYPAQCFEPDTGVDPHLVSVQNAVGDLEKLLDSVRQRGPIPDSRESLEAAERESRAPSVRRPERNSVRELSLDDREGQSPRALSVIQKLEKARSGRVRRASREEEDARVRAAQRASELRHDVANERNARAQQSLVSSLGKPLHDSLKRYERRILDCKLLDGARNSLVGELDDYQRQFATPFSSARAVLTDASRSSDDLRDSLRALKQLSAKGADPIDRVEQAIRTYANAIEPLSGRTELLSQADELQKGFSDTAAAGGFQAFSKRLTEQSESWDELLGIETDDPNNARVANAAATLDKLQHLVADLGSMTQALQLDREAVKAALKLNAATPYFEFVREYKSSEPEELKVEISSRRVSSDGTPSGRKQRLQLIPTRVGFRNERLAASVGGALDTSSDERLFGALLGHVQFSRRGAPRARRVTAFGGTFGVAARLSESPSPQLLVGAHLELDRKLVLGLGVRRTEVTDSTDPDPEQSQYDWKPAIFFSYRFYSR